jgi:hypothetical protein
VDTLCGPPFCVERGTLLDDSHAAATRYSVLAGKLAQAAYSAEFDALRGEAEHAQSEALATRRALNAHTEQHGCKPNNTRALQAEQHGCTLM